MSLTEEQRRAVDAEGSVVVVAGAGTGKTHMLTERYLHHLSEDGSLPWRWWPSPSPRRPQRS